MTKVTNAALFFLAAGILTSVTILSAYQILFAIPLIYYTYLAVKNKDWNLPKSAWWLLAFAGVAFLSLVVNYELVPRPSKNFGRVKYFLFGALGILVMKAWLKEATLKAKKFLTCSFLLSIVVAGGYSVYTYFFLGLERAEPLTETMRYGYGSAMILLMLLSALLHHDKAKGWLDWRFGVFAFVVGFLGMYFTYTRGALLGFLSGLPFLLYFYKPKVGITLGGLAVLAILGLGAIYLFGSGNYESRFLVNKNTKADVIRRSQWISAAIAIQEKPVLGWGLSNFHTQLKRIKHEHDLDAKDYDDAHSHNLFLEVASGTGLIGLVFFLGWLISWAIESFKAGGLTRALVIPLGAAFVTSSQFEVTLDANNASMIFTLYALSSSAHKHIKNNQSSE